MMSISEILEELAYDNGELPREAIESAVAKRVEITPFLLRLLEEALQNIDLLMEDEGYQGHLYAIYLLAQFRERRAYPLIIDLFSYPGDIPHVIGGDLITEDLGRILATVSGSECGLIEKMIENPTVNEYVRAAGMVSLVQKVGTQLLLRERAMDYFKSLFLEKLEKRASFVWDTLTLCSTHLYPDELYPYIEKSYQQGLIDPKFLSLEEIQQVLQSKKEAHLLLLSENCELIEDTVTEMEKWLTLSSTQT